LRFPDRVYWERHCVTALAVTVLIVDDHPSFLAAASTMLAMEGYNVVAVAHDGESAVRLTEELLPQVVLLDVQLPDIDGFEVAERLRGLAQPPKVVLISSRDSNAYGSKVLTAPVRGFISKEQLSGERLAALVDGL
jgi:DNA-binding NarL/FixJ family response regulator